jgi:hypothetical protein
MTDHGGATAHSPRAPDRARTAQWPGHSSDSPRGSVDGFPRGYTFSSARKALITTSEEAARCRVPVAGV